jgi:hypothetical protein
VRGVLQPVLDELGVTLRVMHGFGSATAVYDVAAETACADRELIVLYVGDWDPSGLYMSQVDLPARLARYEGVCDIRRIALTEDDIGPDLPSFAAVTKMQDPRYRWYVDHTGSRCWELDAMDPRDLRERVKAEINALIDRPAWDRAIEVENAEVESMKAFHKVWKESILGQAPICSGGQA